MTLGYEFSLLEDAVSEYGDGGSSREALAKVEEAHQRMRAALEDIAAGRREYELSREFDFEQEFWFLVKLAEGAVGNA